MIMVDVQVVSMDRNYNFSLDEQVAVNSVIMEIAELVCQKEGCHLLQNQQEFLLCSPNSSQILKPELSLEEQGIQNGDHLLLV